MHGVLPVEDVPEALPAHVDPAGELGHADAAVLSGALYLAQGREPLEVLESSQTVPILLLRMGKRAYYRAGCSHFGNT